MALLNKGKNYIINGAMDFWQRGTSFAAIAHGTYSADRFMYVKSGTAVHTLTQDTDVPTFAQSGFTFPFSTRLNLTTAQASLTTNQMYQIQHRIEGQVFAPLRNKTFTLSFWVKATLAGTYSISFQDSTALASYVADYTINASATWEKKTITVTHSDSLVSWNWTTGVGLIVEWTLASGPSVRAGSTGQWGAGDFRSSNNQVNGVQTGATDFRIAGVMLEESEQSSSFERAGGNTLNELTLCQRYYELMDNLTVYGFNNGSNWFTFQAIKRVPPTFTITPISNSNATGVNFTTTGVTHGFCMQADVPSSGIFKNVATIRVDAEL